MSRCYLGDHIAGDHIHTDITSTNEERQQKYRLGAVSNRLLRGLGGELNIFLNGSKPLLFASAMVPNIWYP